MEQLKNQNADLDLNSAAATVLTHTPDATYHRRVFALINLGDGTKNLDGTGGDFELTIEIGSQVWKGGSQTVTLGTGVRSAIVTEVFPVPANTAVTIKVLSPNGADTDVDVTALLFAEDDVNIHRIDGNRAAAIRQALAAGQIIPGTVNTGNVASTSTTFQSDDITEQTADHFAGRNVLWLTGNLNGQMTDITDFAWDGANSEAMFTVTGLTEAPANNDTFLII